MNDLSEVRPLPGPLAPISARPTVDRLARYFLGGIFLLLLLGFLYLARDYLLPVSIAVVLAIVLNPIVRWLKRRNIPAPVSASGLVAALLFGFVSVGYLLSGPISGIVSDAPRISAAVQEKFSILRRPVEALERTTASLEEIVGPPEPSEKVVVDGGSSAVLGYIAADAGQRLAATAFCLVLLLFILASGDLFLEKLIKVMPTLSDKKLALRIARDVEFEVSRYLLTVAIINIGLGAVVGAAFWILGMPSPILWAIFATVANFLPYIGAALVAIAAFGVAVMSFDTLAGTLLPVLAFIALTAIEGQIVTPLIVGRRHTLNTVVVLASIAFWGWIWGIVGALIAVPMLVTVKVFADHVEAFQPLGEFLSARAVPQIDPGEKS